MSDINGKINNLLSLSLNHLEATLYLYLAENTPSSALFLSRTLAIPRTSIYDTLTRLIEKGLVERVVRDKSTQYKASPLSQFDSFITSEQEKITTMTSSLKALQSQLKTRVGELKNTEVRYYQGAEGMRQMVWNCLRAKGEIVGYSVFGRVDVVGIKFQQRFVQEFSTRKLSDRVIANPTKRTLVLFSKTSSQVFTRCPSKYSNNLISSSIFLVTP
jgi:sugar-specific transcriptional regulator TrmB